MSMRVLTKLLEYISNL